MMNLDTILMGKMMMMKRMMSSMSYLVKRIPSMMGLSARMRGLSAMSFHMGLNVLSSHMRGLSAMNFHMGLNVLSFHMKGLSAMSFHMGLNGLNSGVMTKIVSMMG